MKESEIYYLEITLERCRFGYFFRQPPTKAELKPLLVNTWKGLKPDTQEYAWDLLLIDTELPDSIIFVGKIQTMLGQVECRKAKLFENGCN